MKCKLKKLFFIMILIVVSSSLYASLIGFSFEHSIPPSKMIHEIGNAYLVMINSSDLLRTKSDNSNNPNQSRMVLLEQGKPIGKAHAVHNDIRANGKGLYSFWEGDLYFSTSDNSDPRYNGRIYQVKIFYFLDLTVVAGGLTSVLLLGVGFIVNMRCGFLRRSFFFKILSNLKRYMGLVVGVVLLEINIIGLIVPLDYSSNLIPKIRSDKEHLSFSWAFNELKNLEISNDSSTLIAQRAMAIVHKRMVNYCAPGVGFCSEMNNFKYKRILSVSPMENWILWLLSFTPFDSFQSYSFADPYRTLRRGLGMCGDQASLLIIFLEKMGYEVGIQGLDGHIVVWMKEKDQIILLDPDFGVMLPFNAIFARSNLKEVSILYKNGLESLQDEMFNSIVKTYRNPKEPNSQGERPWLKPSKSYTIREEVFYFLKWGIPIALIAQLLVIRTILNRCETWRGSRVDRML